MLTYKRADDKGNPTVWYQNYSTTMAILGILLNTAQITFDRTMTLKINEQTGQYEVLGEKETKEMSILDWLETNMYFSC
ncbi:MAG: hypothetical protein MJ223_04275 [Mycoplasmoidaceae bacterium]|nr:hypothetical protein [Mycoplasmoidaceae bacterium]